MTDPEANQLSFKGQNQEKLTFKKTSQKLHPQRKTLKIHQQREKLATLLIK